MANLSLLPSSFFNIILKIKWGGFRNKLEGQKFAIKAIAAIMVTNKSHNNATFNLLLNDKFLSKKVF